MVCRPNARSLAVSQGKGVDEESAQASGIMEAIELYHAEHITLSLRLASWNELRFSEPLMSLVGLPRISMSRFAPDLPLLWIEGRDLLTSEPEWVPYELVHMNFTMPFPPGSGCFVMGSNGLASGNHPLEAIAHALCEVIERDAVTLFDFQLPEEQLRRRVDTATIDEMDCRRLLDACERANISVGLWDITSDIAVPAFKCVLLERDSGPFRSLGPLEGTGCHPAREVALLRAITEAAQARLTVISGSRDDCFRSHYLEVQDPERMQRARALLHRQGTRSFDATETYVHDTFEQDIAVIVAQLRQAGLGQVVVVDLTKREFGLPVFRVIVPGLETSRRIGGYVPGPRARPLLDRLISESRR
jgi:ribosomal protein S12 methylthiotransferase accessory factor